MYSKNQKEITMKKTLLLSVVASTMIMAGGDIAPVEPVVEAPAVVSGWEFSGQGVVYYQTNDMLDLLGDGDEGLFAQTSSQADAGIQLRATNNDVIGGIGAGFAVNGLTTLNLENWMVAGVMQMTGNPALGNDIDDMTDGGWISEAYLTYGFGNTSIKAGRQTLPKALSPLAFSEDWNVFQNTYDAVLVVNTDISNTTLVGAWVAGANWNSNGMTNLSDFNSLNEDDGVYMLTVQNKSIADLTLTGSYYYGADFHDGQNDLDAIWGDAQYNAASFNVGVQGGQVSHDAFSDDINSFGAKIGTTFAGINAEVAYSNVNDGGLNGVYEGGLNLGGNTSALYTTTMVDQLWWATMTNWDSEKFVVRAAMDALGGNLSALYANNDIHGNSIDEFNIAYSTNLTDSLGLDVSYAFIDADQALMDMIDEEAFTDNSANVVRVIARYNF